MTTTLEKPKTKSSKPTPAEKLVAELITLMESGKDPCKKEWDCPVQGRHTNILTKNSYTGQNPALLGFYQIARGYPLPLWAAPGQIKSRGWSIRKGSKACYVCKPNMYQIETENTFGEKIKEYRISNFSYIGIFNV